MSKSVFRVTRNKAVSYVVAPDLLTVLSDMVAASGRPPSRRPAYPASTR